MKRAIFTRTWDDGDTERFYAVMSEEGALVAKLYARGPHYVDIHTRRQDGGSHECEFIFCYRCELTVMEIPEAYGILRAISNGDWGPLLRSFADRFAPVEERPPVHVGSES